MDSLVLYSPAGSSFQLGSYIMYDPGPDFGEAGLMVPRFAINPAAEGGVRSHREIGIRRFTIPMRVGSSAAYTDQQAISLMRLYADKGAYIDVQPEGTPSGESVRFDVEDGRFELSYNPFLNRIDRNDGNLLLDVQPYGYWPTMILLASAASVGGPGVLTFSGGSIFGDAPGLAEVFIAPTSATSYGAVQRTDVAMWSLSARPSFQAFWPAASALPSVYTPAPTLTNPTLIGDKFAPGSQALFVITWSPSVANQIPGNTLTTLWTELTEWVIPPVLEPAYRGRARAFSWVRWDVPTLVPDLPFRMALDVQSGTAYYAALASAGPIASLPQSIASNSSPGGKGASPAYSLLDFGEITIPPVASQAFETRIRLWANWATSNFGYATTASAGLFIGGLYLQPLDGGAGIMPRGIQVPSWNSLTTQFTAPLFISAVTRDVTLESATSGVASRQPYLNALANYRGLLPLVGASTIQLDVNLGGKQASAGTPTGQPPLRSEPHFAQVSVRYRPRFTFLKGI